METETAETAEPVALQRTRYYSKKQEGILFARCHKEDQDPTVEDGRALRQWTFGSDKGETLGYSDTSITGMVKAAWVSEFPRDGSVVYSFNISLATKTHDAVFQCELYGGDTFTVMQAIGGINLNQPLTIRAYLDPKGKYYSNARKQDVIPARVAFEQAGRPISWTFAWQKETRTFEGLPGPEIETKFGKEVKNMDARNKVFDAEIEKFITRVEQECVHHNADRGQTPAEIEADKQLDKEFGSDDDLFE